MLITAPLWCMADRQDQSGQPYHCLTVAGLANGAFKRYCKIVNKAASLTF